MTKPIKKIPMEQKPEDAKSIHDLSTEELEKKLQARKQAQIEVVFKKLAELEEQHKVNIGVQVDVQKLANIISYMIANKMDLISLKHEVWIT